MDNVRYFSVLYGARADDSCAWFAPPKAGPTLTSVTHCAPIHTLSISGQPSYTARSQDPLMLAPPGLFPSHTRLHPRSSSAHLSAIGIPLECEGQQRAVDGASTYREEEWEDHRDRDWEHGKGSNEKTVAHDTITDPTTTKPTSGGLRGTMGANGIVKGRGTRSILGTGMGTVHQNARTAGRLPALGPG
ncbi:hypothetical protein BD779DRAFT_1477734 [Infundibulicybe gibba]|nr:hypothetical protein BD779DRAFT_1477734 [Infundibulicybe gibba]